ncbi:ammonia-dependent NAD(+) synthetase [Brevibacterium sp. 50QC2O2]|jgi:NAD+ synthase|uniref:ammonia-dependent NAD(+) synthetase n=1 Tax=Brevibacterium TaxID=1696 RepID=UPI00211C3A82|nr:MULTISPECIES: ammonia-dependent NAD(+) synthetase [unclassified Brevibacterium]MCQ9366943.1 ammonia-dependent NAD(+) synthetase [Brevibacterium sp. 91QC2O2]MCQ9384093.1 ammonia-dependent NAD(+) synthetase [Brevibacterium sp. 68QC2CO]MCQ9388429.1 ammonia-dependent NAD(+) synthetase [Brevibacterium sp. 50QC2O2]
MSFSAAEIRSLLGVRPRIDPALEVAHRVQFLVEYCLTTGARGFVVGVSGGQDSALTGRLCQLAAEELRRRGEDAALLAVRLPYRVQADEDDARTALDFIRPDQQLAFNVAGAVDGLSAEFADSVGTAMSDFTKGNVKARMRMVALYALAGEHNLLVVGTGHAAEAVTGFFTKHGDGGSDVSPLAGLDKRQGRSLLEHLGAPERLWVKEPTGDLLDGAPGQPDEEALGLTYAQIDDFLEGAPVADAVTEALEIRFQNTVHKRRPPVCPGDNWWIRF